MINITIIITVIIICYLQYHYQGGGADLGIPDGGGCVLSLRGRGDLQHALLSTSPPGDRPLRHRCHGHPAAKPHQWNALGKYLIIFLDDYMDSCC